MQIELDTERIHREVVERITTSLYYDAKEAVLTVVKNEVRAALQAKAREEATTIIAAMRLPDGRTFREYVEGLLTKTQQYSQRPRLLDVVDEVVRDYSRRWWEEIFEARLPGIRDEVQNRILQMTMESVLKGVR